MSMTIAITGKGGVGKTTLSSLIIQWLVSQNKTPVLAVDADCNSNLNEALGVEYESTVGGIRENARNEAAALNGIAKSEFLELRIQEALIEQAGYDLIVMGRPEGPGCYCFANNVLRDVLKKLSADYKYVVVDSEAGIEHISRRTVLSLDCLLVVSDCTVRGIRTAGRISQLTEEMGTPVAKRGLVVNRVPDGVLPDSIKQEVEATGLPLIAVIPSDENVAAMDAGGMAVADIPSGSLMRIAVDSLMKDLLS